MSNFVYKPNLQNRRERSYLNLSRHAVLKAVPQSFKSDVAGGAAEVLEHSSRLGKPQPMSSVPLSYSSRGKV